MKMEALIGKKLSVATMALFAAVVAFALTVPAPAYAAGLEAAGVKTAQTTATSTTKTVAAKKTTKTKTVKKQGFTTSTKAIKKKATKVKSGTSSLNFKGGAGYLKFTATKTKKYSFTFSGVKAANNRGASAFVEVQTPYKSDSSYSFLTNVKTKGGTSSTLWLAYQGHKFNYYSNALSRPIAKRAGTIKLKKGQEIFFYFSGTQKNTRATLKIA